MQWRRQLWQRLHQVRQQHRKHGHTCGLRIKALLWREVCLKELERRSLESNSQQTTLLYSLIFINTHEISLKFPLARVPCPPESWPSCCCAPRSPFGRLVPWDTRPQPQLAMSQAMLSIHLTLRSEPKIPRNEGGPLSIGLKRSIRP